MRGSFFVVLGAAVAATSACSVYDSSLLLSKSTSGTGGGAGTGGGSNAGGAGTGATGSGGGGGGGAGNAGGTGAAAGTGGGACVHATFPPQPTSVITPGGKIEFVVVQSSIDLGDSPPNAGAEPTHWDTIGFDIDGICTPTPAEEANGANVTKNQECHIPAYGAGVPDGTNGQDNAVGKIIQLTRDKLNNFNSDIYSAALHNGVTNVVIHVTGYNGEPNDDQVRVETLVSAPFDSPPKTKGAVPKWDGTDVWPIASDSVKNGSLATPLFVDNNAYVTDGKVVASLTTATLRLVVGLTAISTVNLSLNLHGAYVVCDLKPTTVGPWGWLLQNCTLGARWVADDLIHQLSHFPDPASPANAPFPLCTNSNLYAVFKDAICQLEDVSSSGLTQPTTDCDALSMGVTFNTLPGVLGDVFTINSIGELCEGAGSALPYHGQPSHDSCESLLNTDAGAAGAAGGGGTAGAGGTSSTKDASVDGAKGGAGGASGAGGVQDSGNTG